MKIKDYGDFTKELKKAGFSMGGGNAEGIFAIIPWGWNEEPPYETDVKWHTGEMETDPWEWRIRVLEERDDIAYAKVFFKKSGYISKDWVPYFIACRRGTRTFEETYMDGKLSYEAKRIYDCILEAGAIPSHDLKKMAGFTSKEKSSFDRALIELQMMMFITVCGRKQKISAEGNQYGWSSTMLCTIEEFWGKEIIEKSSQITTGDAVAAITEQILLLNPQAKEKNIKKFIFGRSGN